LKRAKLGIKPRLPLLCDFTSAKREMTDKGEMGGTLLGQQIEKAMSIQSRNDAGTYIAVWDNRRHERRHISGTRSTAGFG
jgi:hypothetical protein